MNTCTSLYVGQISLSRLLTLCAIFLTIICYVSQVGSEAKVHRVAPWFHWDCLLEFTLFAHLTRICSSAGD